MKMLKREKKKGIALIMALWIMVALLVICSSFVYMMRIELRIAKDYTYGVKAHYLARAGIARALGELNADNVDLPPRYKNTDSLHEAWFATFSENVEYTGDYTVMEWDEKWFPFGEGGYRVRLIDEAGMHNINAMEGGIEHQNSLVGMDDLFEETTYGYDKACRIRDYRDEDVVAMDSTSGGHGWDSPDCKNKPYDTIREIQKVKDINDTTNPLAVYTNELTVHSHGYDTTLTGEARVNLNTASEGDIYAVLNDAGDSDPSTAAYSIYTLVTAGGGKPVGGWSVVGCIYDQLSDTGNIQSRTMKKVADKFTVAPPTANPIYYKPAANPTYILGPININTAPKGTLCSLIYIGPAKAKYIIETRHGVREPYWDRIEDAVQGTPANPFTYGVADSGEYGRGELILTYKCTAYTFYHMSDQVTVRSDRFRIVSTGEVRKGGRVVAQRKIEAVVDRHYHDQDPTASGIVTGAFHTMGPFEILYWSETVPEFLD